EAARPAVPEPPILWLFGASAVAWALRFGANIGKGPGREGFQAIRMKRLADPRFASFGGAILGRKSPFSFARSFRATPMRERSLISQTIAAQINPRSER